MTSPCRDPVSDALEARGPVWLPGISGPLASSARAALHAQRRIGAGGYGTARMLANDPDAERDEAARIDLPLLFEAREPLIVETLRRSPARRYVDLGLVFASPSEAARATPRLSSAFERLASVPEVARAIGAVLSSVHIVVPDGPDYDVSYSDPTLPFSIFVGVGAEPGTCADLRLAEAVLHESMHLQLTLIEEAVPLLSGHDERHHSPWQNTMRPARGILHGTYVFAVIRDFMGAIASDGSLTPAERRHVLERIETCDREVSAASADLLNGRALSAAGRTLVMRLASPGA